MPNPSLEKLRETEAIRRQQELSSHEHDWTLMECQRFNRFRLAALMQHGTFERFQKSTESFDWYCWQASSWQFQQAAEHRAGAC